MHCLFFFFFPTHFLPTSCTICMAMATGSPREEEDTEKNIGRPQRQSATGTDAISQTSQVSSETADDDWAGVDLGLRLTCSGVAPSEPALENPPDGGLRAWLQGVVSSPRSLCKQDLTKGVSRWNAYYGFHHLVNSPSCTCCLVFADMASPAKGAS